MAIEILRAGPDQPIYLADSIAGLRAPSYCDCVFPRTPEMLAFKGNIHEHITCKCGEDEGHALEWVWDKETADPECFISGPNITFHPTYSQGTAVIRGEKRLEPGMIHYWEIKIITSLSGTETMLGIGTDKVDLLSNRFRFTSVLGLDEQSWGYSFRGKTQYNGQSKYYGKTFSQGCLVGVLLDLSRGYLEFYLNRRSLGIAYKNIPTDPSVKLYAMACSTAANSSIRLINSTSCPDNLQYRTMKVVSKRPEILAELNSMPGLKFLSERYWYLIPIIQYSLEQQKNMLTLEDEAILRSHRAAKKFRFDVSENIDVVDIYSDAHTIKHRNTFHYDSDDELDDPFLQPENLLFFFCDH